MKVILTPDSFKGSLSSIEAANAMEAGIRRVLPSAEIISIPISDGGEGTVETLSHIKNSRIIQRKVKGPLGNWVNAKYLMTQENSAVIELAEAAGLTLLKSEERNPMEASTFGVGELIKDALDNGTKSIVLALGGSATNDGGAGIAAALGIRILDGAGQEVTPNATGLSKAVRIDISRMDKRLLEIPIEIACDVQNPLCGVLGASRVYGLQKGATSQMALLLDDILEKYSSLVAEACGKNISKIPGAGAAGGAAVPLLAFAGAILRSGIDMILSLTNFDLLLNGADYVFTGEGKLDKQTVYGKAVGGVASRAAAQNVPVLAFCGTLQKGYEELLSNGLTAAFSIVPAPMSLEDCVMKAGELLADTVEQVFRTINSKKVLP